MMVIKSKSDVSIQNHILRNFLLYDKKKQKAGYLKLCLSIKLEHKVQGLEWVRLGTQKELILRYVLDKASGD